MVSTPWQLFIYVSLHSSFSTDGGIRHICVVADLSYTCMKVIRVDTYDLNDIIYCV